MARITGDGEISSSMDPVVILGLFISFAVILTILNPMYLIPYIYMYRNHKRTDNSKYYGLNIALISIYLSTLITIVIQILTFLRVFENLVLSDNTQSNVLTIFVVGSGLFPRLVAYSSVLNSILSGTFISGSYLGFFLITSFTPIFFIIYGFGYYLRHRVYAIQNYAQYKVFKAQSILVILNLIIIVVIIVLNSIYIHRQINEAVMKGDLSLCEKLENISAMEKCISIYMRKDPNFYKCNVLSENLYLEDFCIDEVAKYNQDWKQCFGLDKSSRIRGCVYDLAVK
ncbi:MAG TPA: hypothetical protein PLS49_06105, partial [Candidatus Woesebacteria bacterium]|nr:hypothetical protein [Candidatus Woesebacteria bacterium]